MEVWKGFNYRSKNETLWVELMNMSTIEIGIGYLPANVVAIPGKYNDSYDIPPGTYVIQNAGKSQVGTSGIERIVFLTASLVSIACAAIWLCTNWRKGVKGTASTPPAPSSDAASQGTSGTALLSMNGDNDVSVRAFEHKLQYYYYDSTKSNLEVFEKDSNRDNVTEEDFESGTTLLRRMYGLDLLMWARQDSGQTAEQLNALQWKSDAIFTEVRRLADEWDEILQNPMAGATPRELKEMAEVRSILDEFPPERYQNKRPIEYDSLDPQTHRRRFGFV